MMSPLTSPNYSQEQIDWIIDHCVCAFKTLPTPIIVTVELDGSFAFELHGTLDDDHKLHVNKMLELPLRNEVDLHNSIVPTVAQSILDEFYAKENYDAATSTSASA